jgi:UDP-N-acetylmuramoyl-tripeptide--D-alanyl-D-alanine ligase
MKNALDILTMLAKKQQLRAVFVCGDMAELGNQAEKFHVELGRLIAKTGVGLLLTVGNLASSAADAAKRENPALQTRSFADPAELCNNLHQFIQDSDIILVKGSRVNKLELVVDKLKKLFSESCPASARVTGHESRDTK